MIPAHLQKVTKSYTIAYPAHEPREGDPHYKDFDHYNRVSRKDPVAYRCQVGAHRNDFSECDTDAPLELHHWHIEFALQNNVDLKWLEVDYPGVSDPDALGAWINSAANLQWLCLRHHRALDGVHKLSASDYEGIHYVRNLVAPDQGEPA